jgi:hypothetical protein
VGVTARAGSSIWSDFLLRVFAGVIMTARGGKGMVIFQSFSVLGVCPWSECVGVQGRWMNGIAGEFWDRWKSVLPHEAA